jgi:hypothetical protein
MRRGRLRREPIKHFYKYNSVDKKEPLLPALRSLEGEAGNLSNNFTNY